MYSPNGRALNLVDDSDVWLANGELRRADQQPLHGSYFTDLANTFSNGNAYVSFSVRERTAGNLPANSKFYVNAFDTDARFNPLG